MKKFVLKIVFLLILAFLTLLMFAGSDGRKIIADFDREVFSGSAVSVMTAIWFAILFALFRRKKA